MKSYDVIVVGAGNGGLTAAATTAKAGYKTLLLEKHNLPGGCATSFVRGRFEFEVALHELCDRSTDELLICTENIFRELGIKVPLAREETLFRTITTGEDGYDVTLRAGDEGFLEDMEKACPGCRASIEELLRLNDDIDAAMRYMETGALNPVKLFSDYSTFVKLASHSMNDLYEALNVPEKARSLFSTYWGYLGVPTDELNAMHYLSLLMAYMRGKPSMPHHRSHELSLALVERIRHFGGEIRFNSEVTGFLYDDSGAACGVVVGGEEIYGKRIISNIIPNNVFNRSDLSKISKKSRKLANARQFGMSAVTAYIGLDCTMEELGVDDYSVFVSCDNDSRRQYNVCRNGGNGFYIINCLNKVLPDATPAGTCTLFLTVPVFEGYFPEGVTARNYRKFKSDFVRKYLEHYEKLMNIDIISHIEEIEIATPVTFAHYLDTPRGTIYGYANSGRDGVVIRTALKDAEYDTKNLYFCGGHCIRGDGFPSGYITGDMAGKAAVESLRREG